ncbi:hypothetical protein QMW88_07340 [Cronobacter dublinensis]|uniref:hypothetical protein n=1 Tax=Cronobacter dublinensis TaxID=413497 RepID=UPI0024C3139E|nr:hypothetical protein [Cronobacter dublinensis]MDK1192624.1 hypothetical protein [Cronobacter dublinensis]MDK1201083.1 hypothetical protein [Cronobacter dublinensis]
MDNRNYFAREEFKSAATHSMEVLNVFMKSREIPLNSFEKQLCSTLYHILNNMLQFPALWEERCSLKTEGHNNHLIYMLNECKPEIDIIQNIYVELYPYAAEAMAFNIENPPQTLTIFFDFGLDYLESFNKETRAKIHSTLLRQPTSILKKCMEKVNISGYQKALQQINETEKRLSSLQVELNEKLARANELEKQLLKHEDAFNFVELFRGFVRLGKMKRLELNKTKKLLYFLAAIIPVGIIVEIICFALYFEDGNTTAHLIKLIPSASLIVLLLYYFRIVLKTFNSIKSQVMQIELRKSLCQFIQRYGEYAKEINTGIKENEKSPLSKFEDVIFSNIMASEDKTPSTFDGMEQLASMINALKSK